MAQILVDDAVGQAVIDRMIGAAVNMLDTYLPALLSVIYANELPEEATRRLGLRQEVEAAGAAVDVER